MSLEFDEVNHIYKLDGRRLPSVTGILSVLNNFDMIPKDVLERKRLLGTALHKAIELHINDDLDTSTIHQDVTPYFNAYLKFESDTGFKPDFSEARIFSKTFGYAGTLDLIGALNSERVLIDTKTVAVLGCSVGPQLAAYKHGFEELNPDMPIKKRFSLQLKPDGTYKLPEYKDKRDIEIFKSCLNIHRWKNG